MIEKKGIKTAAPLPTRLSLGFLPCEHGAPSGAISRNGMIVHGG